LANLPALPAEAAGQTNPHARGQALMDPQETLPLELQRDPGQSRHQD
jgi:hypothetical protein